MSFVNWPGWPLPLVGFDGSNAGQPNFQVSTMDASGEGAGWVIEAPKTGNIKAVGFEVGTVTNNPDNGLRVALQNLTSGLPSAETHFRVVTPVTANTWHETGIISDDGTDTGALRAVTRGDRLAITIDFESFVVGDSLQIRYASNLGFAGQFSGGFPYVIQDVGSGWAKTGSGEDMLVVAVQYDDDIWYPVSNAAPISVAGSVLSVTSSSDPNEFALKFQLSVPMRCAGLAYRVSHATPNTGNTIGQLYDAAGNILATGGTLSSLLSGNTTTGNTFWVRFPTSVELAANTTYRLGVRSSSTGNVDFYFVSANSVALMNAMPNGTNFSYSQRAYSAGAGVWTDVATSVPMITPLIDAIDPVKGFGGALGLGGLGIMQNIAPYFRRMRGRSGGR